MFLSLFKTLLVQKSQRVPVFQAVVWFSKNTRSSNISDDYTRPSQKHLVIFEQEVF